MRRINICFFICFMLLTGFSSITVASGTTEKDSIFDFKSIKKIYINPEISYADGCEIPEFNMLYNMVIWNDESTRLKNYRIVDKEIIADAFIEAHILKWYSDNYWVDEKYYTTTGIERHVDEIRDKSHVEYIDIDAYTEGHYVYRDNFSIEYTVTNNEGKVIYKRTENRYSTDNKIHKEIEDSIENFYKDFNKLAKD